MPGEPKLVIPVEDRTNGVPSARSHEPSTGRIAKEILGLDIPPTVRKELARILLTVGEEALSEPDPKTAPGGGGGSGKTKIPGWLAHLLITVGAYLVLSIGQGALLGGDEEAQKAVLEEIGTLRTEIRIGFNDLEDQVVDLQVRQDQQDEAMTSFIYSEAEYSDLPMEVQRYLGVVDAQDKAIQRQKPKKETPNEPPTPTDN